MSVSAATLILVLAAIATSFGARLVRAAAPSLHMVDVPNERSLHSKPTPRGGGLAIVVVCAVGLACGALLGIRPAPPALAGYLVGAALVAVVSAVDDARPVPAGLRLVVQTAAAAIMAVPLALSPATLAINPSGAGVVFAAIAAIVWTVGLTNTYNFMDGIDGLITTQGVIGGLAWAVLASINGLAWQSLLAVLVGGACLGFVTQNWAPARIFLGDVGSSFLGFTFAFLALTIPRHSVQLIGAVVVVWPLLFDAALTFARRLVRRANVFAAHRTHLYQRMVLAGGSAATVAALYAGLTVVAAVIAFALWNSDSLVSRGLAVLAVTGESAALIAIVVRTEGAESRPAAW